MFALVSLSAMNCSLTAWEECCEPYTTSRVYIGAFGGELFSNSSSISQYVTAFFPEVYSIGPLSIIGEGHLKKSSPGFGGVQIGYEGSKPSCSGWSLSTDGELEAFFFKHKRKGHLINKTVNGLEEHDFADSFNANSSVILANVVFGLNTDCLFGLTPYVGGGIGWYWCGTCLTS